MWTNEEGRPVPEKVPCWWCKIPIDTKGQAWVERCYEDGSLQRMHEGCATIDLLEDLLVEREDDPKLVAALQLARLHLIEECGDFVKEAARSEPGGQKLTVV